MTGHPTPQADDERTEPLQLPQADGDGVEQLKDILARHIDQQGWRDRLTTTPPHGGAGRRDLPSKGGRRG